MASAVIGVGPTLLRLAQVQEKSADVLYDGVNSGVQLGTSIVRGNASGRPGPRVITGDFRRSITHDAERRGLQVLAQIGTNKPQGARLEFGFNGVDSLGRRYNQPPFPYLGPSVPAVTEAIYSEVAKAMGKADF